MKIYEVIFSPTGGTAKVADIIAKGFGRDIEVIDISDSNFEKVKLESDSISVIAMPSFGGRAPEIAIDRLKMIDGNGSKAIVVAVYGNRAQEDTLIEMADVCEQCNYDVIAGITAIAEHSIAHQYGTGRPNVDDEKQLSEFVDKIKEKINSNFSNRPNIPGNSPYKKHGSGIVPKATSSCVNCGFCANQCPVDAINRNDCRKTDKKACINCMRCISICPQNARKASKLMVKVIGLALKKSCKDPKKNELFI